MKKMICLKMLGRSLKRVCLDLSKIQSVECCQIRVMSGALCFIVINILFRYSFQIAETIRF